MCEGKWFFKFYLCISLNNIYYAKIYKLDKNVFKQYLTFYIQAFY